MTVVAFAQKGGDGKNSQLDILPGYYDKIQNYVFDSINGIVFYTTTVYSVNLCTTGKILAVDLSTGLKLWERKTKPNTSLYFYNDSLYSFSYDSCYVYNKNGAVIYKTNLGDLYTDAIIYTSDYYTRLNNNNNYDFYSEFLLKHILYKKGSQLQLSTGELRQISTTTNPYFNGNIDLQLSTQYDNVLNNWISNELIFPNKLLSSTIITKKETKNYVILLGDNDEIITIDKINETISIAQYDTLLKQIHLQSIGAHQMVDICPINNDTVLILMKETVKAVGDFTLQMDIIAYSCSQNKIINYPQFSFPKSNGVHDNFYNKTLTYINEFIYIGQGNQWYDNNDPYDSFAFQYYRAKVFSSNFQPFTPKQLNDKILANIIPCDPATESFDLVATMPRNMSAVNNKLITITRKKNSLEDSYGFGGVIDRLKIFCLTNTVKPRPSANNITKLCKYSTNNLITLNFAYYHKEWKWFYSGKDVNIIGNKDSVYLNVGWNATPGNLKVIAKNDCGYWSDTTYIPITFHDIPNLKVTDGFYSCNNPSFAECKMQSNINTNAIKRFRWYNYIGAKVKDNDTLKTTISFNNPDSTGSYIAFIMNDIGCVNYDTAHIYVNKTKPNITVLSDTFTLTCNPQYVILKASSSSPHTIYSWTGTSVLGKDTAQAPNLYYNVQITDTINGCKNKDSAYVKESKKNFPFSTSLSDTVINCKNDSARLYATPVGTLPSSVVFSWQFDSLIHPNPCYTSKKQVTYYKSIATDTLTGCITEQTIKVNYNPTKPTLILPSGNLSINCSASSVLLNAASPNVNTILSWESKYGISTNPIMANDSGVYILTVTDTVNGCSKSDSIFIPKTKDLLINTTADTIVCNNSTLTLNASPILGTAPYSYLWLNYGSTSQQTSFVATNSTKHIIKISDSNGCSGTDTIKVTVPKQLRDSIITFQPCGNTTINGQIQVYGKDGFPPYEYSINNAAYQTSNAFPNLNFGNYSVIIKDALGCSIQTTASINTNSNTFKNDFLAATNVLAADTFVIVDISNPPGDKVQWIFPSNFEIIDTSLIGSPVLSCKDTGEYNITQNVFYGNCELTYSKKIYIRGSAAFASKNAKTNGIEEAVLYPNPNNGQFNLKLKLYKKQWCNAIIADAYGVQKSQINMGETTLYSDVITVPQVGPGTYVLKIIAEYDSKEIVFVVTQ